MTELNYNFIENIQYNEETYQNVFVNVFNLETYESEIIFKTIDQIYNIIKNNDNIIKLITATGNNNSTMVDNNDPTFSMVILFSYDCLELFHKLFKQYYQENTINDDTYSSLLNVIENMHVK